MEPHTSNAAMTKHKAVVEFVWAERKAVTDRGQEPMAREPDAALLMTTSGSLDIFLTRFYEWNCFCNFPTKPSATQCSTRSRINSKKYVIKNKIQTFTIV